MTEKTQTGPIRTIKKYPNRRLYDTHESAYITLEGVRTMVCNSDSFKVVDSRSGEDITRTILLQIICEQETGSNTPCFNNSFLTQLIRSSGDSMNVMVGEFLERSLDAFSQNQDALRQQITAFALRPQRLLDMLIQGWGPRSQNRRRLEGQCTSLEVRKHAASFLDDH